MDKVLEKLKQHQSGTPSNWREEAAFWRSNKSWLRKSQMIAVKILSKMRESRISHTVAHKMGCSQTYVSQILKGQENLSLVNIKK